MTLAVLIGPGEVGEYVARHIRFAAHDAKVLGLASTRSWLTREIPDARFISPLRFSEWRRYLIEFGATEIAFAGFPFKHISGTLRDAITAYYLSLRLRRWLPHSFILAARDMFNDNGIQLQNILSRLPEIRAEENLSVRCHQNFDPSLPFDSAILHVKALPPHLVSQAFIFDNDKFLMKAGITGTDALLEKFGASRVRRSASFPVLCKMSVMPFGVMGLPVIGLRTFELCAQHGVRAVIVQAGNTILMQRSASLDFASRNSISFFALRSDNIEDSS